MNYIAALALLLAMRQAPRLNPNECGDLPCGTIIGDPPICNGKPCPEMHFENIKVYGDTTDWKPEPEPMDIPAKEKIEKIIVGDKVECTTRIGCSNNEATITPIYKVRKKHYCEKGSGRILMHDVDGGWHCIKFQK